MDDDEIIARGGTQEDIDKYAHENGACGLAYSDKCDECGVVDNKIKPNMTISTIYGYDEDNRQRFIVTAVGKNEGYGIDVTDWTVNAIGNHLKELEQLIG